MKKIFAVVAVLVLVLSMSTVAFSASASSKADLTTTLRNDPEVGQYVEAVDKILNQIDNIDLTDEQCDYLLAKFQEFKDIINAHEGFISPEAHAYSAETRSEVMALLNEVVTELGYTSAYVAKAKPVHAGDVVFQVYDDAGSIVFEYDGEYIQFTDTVFTSNTVEYIAIGVGVVVLAAALFFVVRGRKSENI